VLEELKPQGALVKIPPAKTEVSHCYWLVHDRVTGTLGVGRDGLPDCEGDQVYRRLSVLTHSVHPNNLPSRKATAKDLQEGETDQVGTELLCQDNHVNIWEFRLAPQQRCAYHRHLYPYFFLNLTESLTQELNAQGEPVPDKAPNLQTQGQCSVVMASEDLTNHAVHNVGNNVFLQFLVEFPCKSD
jgi:hypothetical protein